MLSPAEDLERRRPVWEALSELFLDTELSEEDLEHIAARLVNCGYSIAELETILRNELGPILKMNAFAWVWQGFDQDQLAAAILKNEASWWSWVPRVTGFGLVREDWNRVRKHLEERLEKV